MDAILTAKEVAHRLKMDVRTVIRHMAAGKIPGFQVTPGGEWKCRKCELEEYLRLKHTERGWVKPIRGIRIIMPEDD